MIAVERPLQVVPTPGGHQQLMVLCGQWVATEKTEVAYEVVVVLVLRLQFGLLAVGLLPGTCAATLDGAGCGAACIGLP